MYMYVGGVEMDVPHDVYCTHVCGLIVFGKRNLVHIALFSTCVCVCVCVPSYALGVHVHVMYMPTASCAL